MIFFFFKDNEDLRNWALFWCLGWLFDEKMNSQEPLGKLTCWFDVSDWLSECDRALNLIQDFWILPLNSVHLRTVYPTHLLTYFLCHLTQSKAQRAPKVIVSLLCNCDEVLSHISNVNPFWKREEKAPEALLENTHFCSHQVSVSSKVAGAKEPTLLLLCVSHNGFHSRIRDLGREAANSARKDKTEAGERQMGERRGPGRGERLCTLSVSSSSQSENIYPHLLCMHFALCWHALELQKPHLWTLPSSEGDSH